MDALRPLLNGTQSVPRCIPTQSVGTIYRYMLAFHPIVIFQP